MIDNGDTRVSPVLKQVARTIRVGGVPVNVIPSQDELAREIVRLRAELEASRERINFLEFTDAALRADIRDLTGEVSA